MRLKVDRAHVEGEAKSRQQSLYLLPGGRWRGALVGACHRRWWVVVGVGLVARCEQRASLAGGRPLGSAMGVDGLSSSFAATSLWRCRTWGGGAFGGKAR